MVYCFLYQIYFRTQANKNSHYQKLGNLTHTIEIHYYNNYI